MKNIIACALLLAAVAGCQKKEEEVDNAATRYTGALQQSVVKAQAAAEKADAAVAEQDARLKEAEALARQ